MLMRFGPFREFDRLPSTRPAREPRGRFRWTPTAATTRSSLP
jgi:hypothetical protein